jgi:hypothetical protein
VKLADCSDETLTEHFRTDCQGILANAIRAYGDIADANLEWISCDCGCIEYVFNEDGVAVCKNCGSIFHDIKISKIEPSVFKWIRGFLQCLRSLLNI